MWNQFLNQSRTQRKFQNTPVIILGDKHSGKRSLVDCLFDISKTTIHNKRLSTQLDTNKMRLKGLTPIIDYAYLNVLDLNDIQYRTHSKLEVYMIQNKYDNQAYTQLHKKQILKNSVIIIMLDFTSPWNFIEQLDGWIKFIYQLQKNAGFNITQLEQMSQKIQKYYKMYKTPQFDQNGKIKKQQHITQQQIKQIIDLPLPAGVLQNNIRIPLIICVNKCDLQSSVLRDQSANKMLYILYHLRKFCIKYGGTLIYNSIKNNSNLNVLYQYILHRTYGMTLKYKPQAINQQAIFIPFGYDSPTLIQDSVVKMDVSRSYSDVIPSPVNKKNLKEEVIVEDDSEFFKKYINMASNVASSTTSAASMSKIDDVSSNSSTAKSAQVQDFFKRLLEKNPSAQGQDSSKISNATNDLIRHTTIQAGMNKKDKPKQEQKQKQKGKQSQVKKETQE